MIAVVAVIVAILALGVGAGTFRVGGVCWVLEGGWSQLCVAGILVGGGRGGSGGNGMGCGVVCVTGGLCGPLRLEVL